MFKTAILKLLGELGDFLAVLFKSGIQQQLKALLPIALNAVKTVASDAALVGGDAKFNAAFGIIMDQMGDKQSTIGKSIVNLAIELAYQKWMDMESNR